MRPCRASGKCLLLSDFITNWNTDTNFGLNQYKIHGKSASRAVSSVQTNGRDDFNRCFAGIRTRRNNGNLKFGYSETETVRDMSADSLVAAAYVSGSNQ